MKKIIFIIFSLFIFLTSYEQNVARLGPNYFVAGVNGNTFDFYRISGTGDQRSMNWCWAACIQMVLNYHGLVVTQEQIVDRCFGQLIDAPGGEREMFIALSGVAPNVWGRSSRIATDEILPDAAAIQIALAMNNPLIVGLRNDNSAVGHANVLTGIYYSISTDSYGNIISIFPDKIVLRDPWPGNPSRIEMNWNEFINRVTSINRVWVTYD
jgi:hypothetical protein